MTLIDACAAMAVLILTFSCCAKSVGQFNRISAETSSLRQETSATRFITGSFQQLGVQLSDSMAVDLNKNCAIENWLKMIRAMYPDVNIEISKNGFTAENQADCLTLYWSFSNGKQQSCCLE